MPRPAGRRVVPHCFSTGINLTASLHWMAAQPDPAGDLVEYCLRPSPLMRKLVANLPPLEDGRVPVPTGPGLGIELDHDERCIGSCANAGGDRTSLSGGGAHNPQEQGEESGTNSLHEVSVQRVPLSSSPPASLHT
ncbi:MAG: hypothetical protein IH908_07055 [Proteobacteria bacterium]|nr:hypothetical protein [Pseudomonadota bacterium]